MKDYDLEKIKKLLLGCKWQWATSMVDVPHEYVVRNKCNLSDSEFLYIVHAQRDLGVHERWGAYNFPYLYVDGYKYWTMGASFEETIIINRQKVFDEFRFLNFPYYDYYTQDESEEICDTIIETFNKPVFEAGIGNGDFIRTTKMKPSEYYGVDPNKACVQTFRNDNSGFYQRCSTKSFEEAFKKWSTWDGVIVALFGTASYIMGQYLRLLKESGRDHFLMFYKKGYCPAQFKEMHHYEYSLEGIKRAFNQSTVVEYGDYVIVSSRPFKIKKKPKQYELFSV